MWASVPGFPLYEASPEGLVRSVYRKRPVVLKPTHRKDGYLHVILMRDGVRHTLLVHRVIAMTFLGPCPDGQEVRHKNRVRSDCRLVNLHYGTRSENTIDAIKHGSRGTQRITEAEARRLKANYSVEQFREAAEEFNISIRQSKRIILGESWSWL